MPEDEAAKVVPFGRGQPRGSFPVLVSITTPCRAVWIPLDYITAGAPSRSSRFEFDQLAVPPPGSFKRQKGVQGELFHLLVWKYYWW